MKESPKPQLKFFLLQRGKYFQLEKKKNASQKLFPNLYKKNKKIKKKGKKKE